MICRETIDIINKITKYQFLKDYNGYNFSSYNHYMEILQNTKTEPLKENLKYNMMNNTNKNSINNKENIDSQQMIYYYESTIPNTRWLFGFDLKNATELEYGALLYSIYLFDEMPYIGGTSRIGNGKVKLELNIELQNNEYIEKYIKHIKNNKNDIIDILNRIF
jgi:ribosomal protein S8